MEKDIIVIERYINHGCGGLLNNGILILAVRDELCNHDSKVDKVH